MATCRLFEKYSVLLEAYHEGAYAHMRSTTRAVHQ